MKYKKSSVYPSLATHKLLARENLKEIQEEVEAICSEAIEQIRTCETHEQIDMLYDEVRATIVGQLKFLY